MGEDRVSGRQSDKVMDDVERLPATSMRFAYRELATPGMVRVAAVVSCMLMATVSVLGPMETRQTLTLIQRFAYFGVITVVMAPICFACGLFTLYVTRNRGPIQTALSLVVMCAIVVAPGVGLAAIAYAPFHGGRSPEESLFWIYLSGVLIFGAGSNAVFYVLWLRLSRPDPGGDAEEAGSEGSLAGPNRAQDASPHQKPVAGTSVQEEAPVRGDATADAIGTGQASRLSEEIGEDIVYVHVSGHYVEIVTTAGTEVLLMRLSDVAKALEGQGMQTHRSYWAAYRHIVRMEVHDRRAVLHLTGGHRVPVSRSLRSAVGAFMRERERLSQ